MSSYDSLDDYAFRPLREAWSSIDRSSAESVQEDRMTLEVGELLMPKQEVYMNWPGDAKIIAPGGSTVYSGPLDSGMRFRPEQTGRYYVRRDGERVGSFEVEPGAGNSGEETTGDPSDWTNVDDSPDVDAEDYGMIVNADTPSGFALAPSAVREGITADEDGTEVDLSDGTDVTVYPRQDADEAIRDIETGDPIDSPVGSGGVEGGVDGGSSSGDGLLGGAVAVVVLLVAAAAALLGGGE